MVVVQDLIWVWGDSLHYQINTFPSLEITLYTAVHFNL